MNAKFFDLKKDKQDRMMNAALKIFAQNGYSHASTDDIVREAHISKGLLFHYFDSKIGVYSFLYDYGVKFFSLELSGAIDPYETNYMELLRQIEAAKMQVSKTYPYLLYFLDKGMKETCPEALLETETSRKQLESDINTILSKADKAPIEAADFFEEYLTMLRCTLDKKMEEHLLDGSFQAEHQYKENIRYINLVEKLLK